MQAASPREQLMIRLAAEAGLRRAEVAQVHTDDLITDSGGYVLIVHGKGAKQRCVPISDDLASQIRQGAVGHTPGAAEAGYLFPNSKDGTAPLSAMYVGAMVSEVLGDGCTMHMLRRRFATRAYRGSRNLRAVQTLLGHESVVTTQRYTAVDDQDLRAAMNAAAAPPG